MNNMKYRRLICILVFAATASLAGSVPGDTPPNILFIAIDDLNDYVNCMDGSLELYDMKKDPNEWYNLAKDEKYNLVIKELKKHIPKEWAPISKYSGYGVNDYFKEKSGWK